MCSAPPRRNNWRCSAQQIGVATLPVVAGQKPVDIARRALDTARKEVFDIVILDTAGRLAIDDELMAEAAAVRDAAIRMKAFWSSMR